MASKSRISYLKRELLLFLILIIIALMIGNFFIYSALAVFEYSEGTNPDLMFKKHIITLLLGGTLSLLAFFIAPVIKDKKWLNVMLYISMVILLALPFLFDPINDTHRWIQIKGFSFQPSELIKFLLPIFLFWYYEQIKEKKENLLFSIFIPFILSSIVILEILLEPDLSTAIIVSILVFISMYLAEVKFSHLLVLIMVVILLVLLAFRLGIIKEYQLGRLKIFSKMQENYQLKMSLDAITEGGIIGKGPFLGEKKYAVPASYSDFIISTIGEEWGKFGIVLVLSIYFLIAREGMVISLKMKDSFGKRFVALFSFWIFIQSFINVGVSVGILPTTGLTLPLMSYGNSSMLSTLTFIGFLAGLVFKEIYYEEVEEGKKEVEIGRSET